MILTEPNPQTLPTVITDMVIAEVSRTDGHGHTDGEVIGAIQTETLNSRARLPFLDAWTFEVFGTLLLATETRRHGQYVVAVEVHPNNWNRR